MNVPFLDVGATYRSLQPEIDEAVARALASGWYILGPEVDAFEQAFSEYTQADHTVGVGNGLDALVLGLQALEIGPGDEVIVPSNTYIATWLAITRVGATIVPVEPDPKTYNLDPNRVADAITPNTKALLPVHLYGRPAPMHDLRTLATQHNLALFADAAQAHGARTEHGSVGSLADMAAWSFYPGKNLGAFGDAGALTTRHPEWADKARVLRNYGSRTKYHNEVLGTNSRLDPIQAAVLSVKLKHLDAWNQRRHEIASLYLKELSGLELLLPQPPAQNTTHAWHLFVVRTPQREAFASFLKERGVQTLIHYPIAPHLQEAYRPLGFGPGDFPIAEAIHREVLSLPIGPHLHQDQVHHVLDSVHAFFQKS